MVVLVAGDWCSDFNVGNFHTAIANSHIHGVFAQHTRQTTHVSHNTIMLFVAVAVVVVVVVGPPAAAE